MTAPSFRTRPEAIRAAEFVVPTAAFAADLRFFRRELGFRLDRIWPADRPARAALSGHGAALLLRRGERVAPVTLSLRVAAPDRFAGGVRALTSPGGHRIELSGAAPPLVIPKAPARFVVNRLGPDGGAWGIGRAGMQYRDLLPGRLDGAMIASHIRIPEGGPVDDEVHYHTIGFQLIFCHRGWVRLVYEDQGPPFVLGAGDSVIQPPEIRHRVLEASPGLEVIEIGVPAEHLTSMDHEMELPTSRLDPERDFAGTRFLRHRASEAAWESGRLPGFEMRKTGVGEATRGLAGVRIARRTPGAPMPRTRHDADIVFAFVRAGSLSVRVGGGATHALAAGDAFALPRGRRVGLLNAADDLEVLEVTLPAHFTTEVLDE